MALEFTPARQAVPCLITATLAGDVVVVNGHLFDFTALAEGDIYPAAALDPAVFASDVTRTGGEITARLFLPVDALGQPLVDPVPVEGEAPPAPLPVLVPQGVVEAENILRAADLEAVRLADQRAGMRLTFSQLLIGLVAEGWITEAEGTAWLAGNGFPTTVQAVIASLPTAARFAVQARLYRMSAAIRLDPMVIALASAEGKTAAEIDQFFITYAAV